MHNAFPRWLAVAFWATSLPALTPRVTVAAPPTWESVATVLKAHCVQCHGPALKESGLNLASPAGLRQGAQSGPVVVPHDIEASRLWQRVRDNEMPPDEPLPAAERKLLQAWIEAGTPGLPAGNAPTGAADHWAFRPLAPVPLPRPGQVVEEGTAIDAFLQARLERDGLGLGPVADPATLLRRASLVLTGLPPTVEELEAWLADTAPGGWERQVDRLLASPALGERWGKYWLDAAGYADSNGYFNADSDRPLAWRYRDWVVRAVNADLPFDEFLTLQLAGDELTPHQSGEPASEELIDRLVATHYLRNGQDGTGESDGNPDEVRADKYFALESCQQNVISSVLGLTIQCAKCHDHKFEPITQVDYYRLQAVFFPAFPIENWKKPNERVHFAPRAGETEAWQAALAALDEQLARDRAALKGVLRTERPKGEVLFADDFSGDKLAPRWSPRAPGDERPAGKVAVQVDSPNRPGAFVRDGGLVIAEGNTQGDSVLSTQGAIDWRPSPVGASVQVTFDLVDNKFDEAGSAAERVGYLIALQNFDDSGPTPGGNLLIDGHPAASSSVHLDYPGTDSKSAGAIGTTGYQPGRNYGVRITALENGKYRLEHLVDFLPEEKSLELTGDDLPPGGFGFEYCCNRSFVVDNVLIEKFAPPAPGSAAEVFARHVAGQRQQLADLQRRRNELANAQPGKLALVTDAGATPPEVHLLVRGNYSTPGEVVTAGGLGFLTDAGREFAVSGPTPAGTTGQRLALARWLLQADSRPRALAARVQVNRMWQQVFGAGLVTTSENLGYGGAEPSHPELLDWLAERYSTGGMSLKGMLRELMLSRAFRQTSDPVERGLASDPGNRLMWRFSPTRLDAEAIRDSWLLMAGSLSRSVGGPPVASTRTGTGEVVIAEGELGAHRRSLYLQQRRTQVVSFLQLFDAPQIVFNSTRRPRSTIPLQSLGLLNGEFAVRRGAELATRLVAEEGDESRRLVRAYRVCLARDPAAGEVEAARAFLEAQRAEYAAGPAADVRSWSDLCQLLMAGNEAMYLR